MASYAFRNGQRLTLWMLYVINLLDTDLFRAFGVHVIVTSAIRTYAEQERIFRARYVTAGNVRGRRVYDTRWWQGVRWYRISSAGTVAAPGSSNHEIQGSKAAVDLRDTGRDAGITVASSARGRWIRQWCRNKGLLIASGDGFDEGWHFDVPGIFRTPPSSGGGSTPTPNPTKRKRRKMSTGVIHTDETSDSKRSGAIVNTESGLFSPFGWFPVSYANGIARGFGLDASAPVTRGSYNQIRSDMAALRKANGNLAVDIADEDVPKVGG